MLAMRKLFAVAICCAAAACSAPVPEFQHLSDQDLADDIGSPDLAARSLAATSGAGDDPETAADPAEQTAPPRKTGGLLALLTGNGAADQSAPKTRHKSIFGLNPAQPSAATSDIAPGTVLPYGQVARVCGLSDKDLGQQVAQYPESRPKHRIYDSAPGTTAPHSLFITGFSDGCARQFTASLAMFGSVEMHEQLRYGLPHEVQPYSETDKAYETLKGRVCGVPRQKPCGAKVARLDDSTVFVSIYETFGSNPNWTNLLLHDGQVLAQDFKGG